MLKNLYNNKLKLGGVLILIILLIAIRAFENLLFYDPFLEYFKSTYMVLPLPKVDIIKLFFSLGFRFYLNSIISIALLRLLFKDTKIIKFSIVLYTLLGICLMISFFFILIQMGENNKMNLFYIRRFIIQPLFIMLFIPAFYYQIKIKQNSLPPQLK